MSKRPRKRANRPHRRPAPPRRPSGTRVLSEYIEGVLDWRDLLHAAEEHPGLAVEIVRAIQARRDSGALPAEEADQLIEGVIEHEAYRMVEPTSVMKALSARINAIEREHGVGDDEAFLRHEGPPEWRMLNRAWEAYVDAAKIRLLESLDEHELAEFVADQWPYDDGYSSAPDDIVLDELLADGDDSVRATTAEENASHLMPPIAVAAESRDAPTRVIAAVISRGDSLLVCQRPSHKRHGDLWEFPGGKVEPDESDEDSARRELAEELGVRVVSAGAAELEVRDEGSSFLIAFVPVEIEGEPECREHSALRWGTAEEIASLPLAPSDRRYVEYRLARASGD